MTDQNEQFIPESVDEQIRQFSGMHDRSQDASHSALSPERQLLRDLRALHSEYAETRDRVWGRLAEHLAQSAQQTRQQTQPGIPPIQSLKKQPRLPERYRNMQEHMKQRPLSRPRPIAQHFAQIAAVFVVVILVGSMLWVFTLTRHANNGPAAPSQSAVAHTATKTPATPAAHLDCKKRFFDPGWYDVCSHGEAQVINQAKPLHGKIVTLKAAYADANRVIINYSIDYSSAGLPKPADRVPIETLALQSGQKLPGGSGTLDWSDASTSPRTLTGLTSYITSAIPAQTSTLNLRLSISSMDQPTDSVSFDFSLLFHAARIANPHQTVTANGIPITLQTVRVSPSETVINLLSLPLEMGATMTGSQPDDNLYYVTVDGWSSKGAGIIADSLNQEDGDKHTPVIGVKLILDEPLFNKSGQWTLHISHKAIAGATADWVFNFTVPQAQ